jgi:hypothetical protein
LDDKWKNQLFRSIFLLFDRSLSFERVSRTSSPVHDFREGFKNGAQYSCLHGIVEVMGDNSNDASDDDSDDNSNDDSDDNVGSGGSSGSGDD